MRVSFRVVDWLWTFSAGGAGRGAKDDTYAQDDASHKPARPQSKTRIQTNNITNNPQPMPMRCSKLHLTLNHLGGVRTGAAVW